MAMQGIDISGTSDSESALTQDYLKDNVKRSSEVDE